MNGKWYFGRINDKNLEPAAVRSGSSGRRDILWFKKLEKRGQKGAKIVEENNSFVAVMVKSVGDFGKLLNNFFNILAIFLFCISNFLDLVSAK